jgi:integrase
MVKPAGKKPEKPRPDFPLTAHNSGTWCKKIAGTIVHFGPWGDPEGAEARLKEHQRAKRAGQAPRPIRDGSITIRELANRFLTYQQGRAKAGEITLRSFADSKGAVDAFIHRVGLDLAVADLVPDHFTAHRARLRERLGAHAMSRTITLVRQMFKWAYAADLIDRPMKFGPGFDKPSAKEMRKGRRKLLYTPEEVRSLINAAGTPLKAMILLGANCGFGNADVGALPESAVDLDGGTIDYRRTKTGFARRCPLWPETVKAMREARKIRPEPASPAVADRFFLTRFGAPFYRETAREERGAMKGADFVDAVSVLFNRLARGIGIKAWRKDRIAGSDPDGRGFYTLRRTHRTLSDECKDPHAAALIMGHDFHSVAGLYVQHIDDSRLKAISDHIRMKLLNKTGSPRPKTSRGSGAGAAHAQESTSTGPGKSGGRKAQRGSGASDRRGSGSRPAADRT